MMPIQIDIQSLVARPQKEPIQTVPIRVIYHDAEVSRPARTKKLSGDRHSICTHFGPAQASNPHGN